MYTDIVNVYTSPPCSPGLQWLAILTLLLALHTEAVSPFGSRRESTVIPREATMAEGFYDEVQTFPRTSFAKRKVQIKLEPLEIPAPVRMGQVFPYY